MYCRVSQLAAFDYASRGICPLLSSPPPAGHKRKSKFSGVSPGGGGGLGAAGTD